jgi:hypothetical protein
MIPEGKIQKGELSFSISSCSHKLNHWSQATYPSCMKTMGLFSWSEDIVWICIIHWWRRLQNDSQLVEVMQASNQKHTITS